MITSVHVFDKIKQLSNKNLNAAPRILLNDLAISLSLSQDSLLVLLIELENRGLVDIHKTPVVSISLTTYGVSQENLSGGLSS